MTLRCPGCDEYLVARELTECADGLWRCSPCARARAAAAGVRTPQVSRRNDSNPKGIDVMVTPGLENYTALKAPLTRQSFYFPPKPKESR